VWGAAVVVVRGADDSDYDQHCQGVAENFGSRHGVGDFPGFLQIACAFHVAALPAGCETLQNDYEEHADDQGSFPEIAENDF
jgi:hypothetical protein